VKAVPRLAVGPLFVYTLVNNRVIFMDKKDSPIVKREEETLLFWQENKIFEKSLAQDSPKGEYVFYDGPPFGTGLPHYGHMLPGTIKDAIPRYKTMRGFHVDRKWGWDCHGLPVENLIEKELNLKTKNDIEAYGIEKFNKACSDSVLRYESDWKKIIPRLGRFVDMEDDYKTMDTSYTESVWWVFKTLHEKGLIYEGFKSMHLCPRCETTLSNFEVAEGYQDIKDMSVTAEFELADEQNTYILAWTTTPWTLVGNVALAVHKDMEYVRVTSGGKDKTYILARDRVADVFGDREYEITGSLLGSDLLGRSYKPLFDYYSQKEDLPNRENGWKVYGGDFVTMEDGTGIVHIAPAFGDDDMKLGVEKNLPFVQHVGKDGRFKEEVLAFKGLSAKPKGNPRETDELVATWLKENNFLFSSKIYEHSYPHCWRCDTPLLNYAADSWFVKVTAVKDKMIKATLESRWVPGFIRDGRFLKGVESAPDWAISRSRYWGAPLPVWKCKSCKEMSVIGSLAELKEKSNGSEPKNKEGKTDMHRPYIDDVILPCVCGGEMRRIPEVFDCWFESGAMPYAQRHYPFENKEWFENNFPADFISEGLDQTRGWFYSLTVLATALFEKPAFKNLVVHGMIMASDGKKMSKRLKNYPDMIEEVVDVYGADALRLYLLPTQLMRSEEMNFRLEGVEEVYKKTLMRLANVVAFYELYASATPVDKGSDNILDRWILARLNALVVSVTDSMEAYELDKATRPFVDFVDDLSTWYLRRSRERMKAGDEGALSTLRRVLLTLAQALAPFAPFMAEDVWRRLQGEGESVHLSRWPVANEMDEGVLEEMRVVREIVSLGQEARAVAGIKVRQPLKELRIKNQELRGKDEFLALIQDEVNVKSVVFIESLESAVEIDTNITSELQAEGQLRDLVRAVQDLRKKAGRAQGDFVSLVVDTDADGMALVQKIESELKNTTKLRAVLYEAVQGETLSIGETVMRIRIVE